METLSIKLGKDEDTVTVSYEDADLLSEEWKVKDGRAYQRLGHVVWMHRMVLDRKLGRPIAEGMVADHINRNSMDNRRSNLREATVSQNNHNKRSNKGYHWDVSRERWRVQIVVNGHQTHLGYFKDEDDAKECYRNASLKHYGEFSPFWSPPND